MSVNRALASLSLATCRYRSKYQLRLFARGVARNANLLAWETITRGGEKRRGDERRGEKDRGKERRGEGGGVKRADLSYPSPRLPPKMLYGKAEMTRGNSMIVKQTDTL